MMIGIQVSDIWNVQVRETQNSFISFSSQPISPKNLRGTTGPEVEVLESHKQRTVLHIITPTVVLNFCILLVSFLHTKM